MENLTYSVDLLRYLNYKPKLNLGFHRYSYLSRVPQNTNTTTNKKGQAMQGRERAIDTLYISPTNNTNRQKKKKNEKQ